MKEVSNKIEIFFNNYRLIDYKKKETVIHLSDEPSGVFYIKEGFVKMNTILANGNELTLNIFKPGSFFPMSWALANTPNNYLFVTMSKASLYKAPKKEVINFLKSEADILFDLTKRVFSGMDGFLTNMTHLVFGNASSRVAAAILLCTKRFGVEDKKNKVVINIRITHQDIANIAGLTRETTSVEIGKLKKGKIISQEKGKLIVINFGKLTNLSLIENPLTGETNII